MLNQLKKELQTKLCQEQDNANLQLLYNEQVKILLQSIVNARNIDDIAVQINLHFTKELFKEYRYSEALTRLEGLLANQDLLSTEELLEILEKKSVALIHLGKYEEAEMICNRLIESDMRVMKCRGLANLGVTYFHLTKYSGKKLLKEALQLFWQALELAETQDSEEKFKIFYNLAIISFEKGRFAEALKNLKESLTLAESSQQKAKVYNEMARIFITESKLDLAKDYLDMAENILIKRPNYHELVLAWNLHIRGLWLKKKGEYTNAINCFELALNVFAERELFSEAAEVSYEMYVLNKFLESEDAEEYLADYQYYSRLIN